MDTRDDGRKTLADLLDVMAALRTPDTGCPWDLEQTFATIAPYTIEEAYEVADAIERGDLVDLEEELGDLLLQVVYHARIAEEQSAFDFGDVVHGVTTKMVRRHPHVFGTPDERAAGAAPGFWEHIKAGERDAKARRKAAPDIDVDQPLDRGSSSPPPSVLDDVPPALPALTRAIKLQNKAARVGFDWPSLSPVLDKMREELAELDETIANAESPTRQQEEFGDLLFVMANVARHLKLDPEEALRSANAKFTRRFHAIEAALAADSRTPADSNLEEMDALWNQAKAAEKQSR
ncbi:MAG: nucleoside triphosphate pyrophosphohydrolase [Pseudomonadota bacterium]